jgi:pimeloyl-ACP methyl ester carboxylesterase
MFDKTAIDRRQLLQAFGLSAAGFGSLSAAANDRPLLTAPGIQQGYVTGPEGQVHYWTMGQGPTLLMIHQAAQSAEEFIAIAPYLADAYRVLAIDLPGHGNSDDPPREFLVEDFTRATLAVLDQLDIQRLSILGHHGGSSVAMDIAAQQPQRVDKLILSGTGVRTREETQALIEGGMTRDIPITTDGDFLLSTWKRYVELTGPDAPPEVTFRPFLVSLQARLRPYDAHYAILRWDRRAVLEKLDLPVLLVQGDGDVFVNRQEQLAEMIRNSTRRVITGGGAFMYYEKPQECADVIRAYLGT